jgi:hypothetical protein
MTWPPSQIYELCDRWKAGESVNQIARAMNITRNAVAGKVCRMGLSDRGSPIKGKRKPAPNGRKAPVKNERLARDDEYLRQAWTAGIPTQEIADHLHRPPSYVSSRASALNIKRPAWYLIELRSRQGAMAIGASWRGPEIDRPAGHRMSEQAIAELYASRRYDSIDTDDNTTGRIHLPMTFVPRAA